MQARGIQCIERGLVSQCGHALSHHFHDARAPCQLTGKGPPFRVTRPSTAAPDERIPDPRHRTGALVRRIHGRDSCAFGHESVGAVKIEAQMAR
jgi:hypothetical protein